MRNTYLILLTALALMTITAHAQEATPLRLVQTIPLPHVEGRIDHMAVDLQGQPFSGAAFGNKSLEVRDQRGWPNLHTITKPPEPQGVVFIPESNTIVVSNGKTGVCDIFDGTSFQPRSSIKFTSDA